MTELAPRPAQPSRQPIPVPARSGLRVARLIRGERPLERAATAARRLVGVAGAMDVECGLVLTLGAARGATNQLTIHTEGKEAADWQDDVAWSLEGIARLEAWTAAASPVPAYLAEMRTVRDLEPLPAALEEEADPRDFAATEIRRQRMLREITPHPQALVFDLADMLVGNLGRGSRRLGLVVRHRMSAAHPVEQHMVTDAIVRTWDPARGSAHDYVGRPVNLRTLWGRDSGPLPARVRAAARQHGTAIELVDLDGAAAARAWSGEPADLAGHAVPAGVALAMLRLPAAGEAPFPGMRSEQPAVTVRPLDPKPRRAAVAVPLGRAMTAEGTWTPAALDLHTGMPRHVVVQGATGTGKSTLLAAIGAGVIAAGGGVTLLDPEGSTVTALLRQIRQERADRVSVIRHGDPELSLPLNLLAADPARLERMIGLYAEMIQRAQDPGSEGIVGPRWRRWFTLVSLATARFLGPEASLVAVAAIAGDIDRVRQLARRIQESDPELSHRLMSEYGRLEGKESVDLSSWAVSKLQELLATQDVRAIFGSGPDPIDLRETIDEGRSLLVDLGAHRLGEPVGRAIGATYLLKHWAALRAATSRRAARDRRGRGPPVLLRPAAEAAGRGAQVRRRSGRRHPAARAALRRALRCARVEHGHVRGAALGPGLGAACLGPARGMARRRPDPAARPHRRGDAELRRRADPAVHAPPRPPRPGPAAHPPGPRRRAGRGIDRGAQPDGGDAVPLAGAALGPRPGAAAGRSLGAQRRAGAAQAGLAGRLAGPATGAKRELLD